MTEREKAQRYKELYPKGTRVLLLHMDDPQAVPSGTRGTVNHVDDMGTLHTDFDNGRTLAIIPGQDSFRTLTEEEIQEEVQDKEHKEKWDRALPFGDENRILLPENPIDCSGLGDFDELEDECWNLVKTYCQYLGIELLSPDREEESVSFDIAKGIQDKILEVLKNAGVQFNFGVEKEQANDQEKLLGPRMEVM